MGKDRSSRRKFLSLAGGSAAGFAALNSPAALLLEALTRGMFGRALAQGTGVKPRKWLDLRIDGAPPRWVFDLFLAPHGASTPLVPNDQVGTSYVANGAGVAIDVEYKTVARLGINVPWIWQYAVPKAGGGTRPMTDLLKNMLHIRGINVGNPSHAGAAELHFRPLGAVQTVSALSADRSDAPIAALYTSVISFQFGSLASKSPVRLTGSNLIKELMTPFMSSASPTFKAGSESLKAYLQAANNEFIKTARAENPRLNVSVKAQQSARALFASAFGDLDKQWEELLAKYNDLIARSFAKNVNLPGINDKPIGISGSRNEIYRLDSVIANNVDLRDLITTNTACSTLAPTFALAEFVLLNDLSDSLSLNIGGIIKVALNNTTITHANDEHFTGKMPSLLLNSYWARAQAACLLELIDALKSKNMFEDTIINMGAEFNRRPRGDGTGADHAHDGASCAVYSGSITGPIVIGDIRTEAATPGPYPGTWGLGAPIKSMGGLTMDVASVASSIATMLRVPSPVTARSSFLKEDDSGKITAKIEKAKNIA